ncbi:MAG: SEC-C metal-binding domain-containing protein, partial [Sporichthyaceae bacterium]
AMAQRDPLVEYQREGFDMFANMMDAIKEESVGFVFNLEVQVDDDAEGSAPGAEASGERHPDVVAKGLDAPRRPARLQYSAPSIDGDTGDAGGVATAVDVEESEYGDVPRNAPCPCGSGKKFKRCHGDPRNRAG